MKGNTAFLLIFFLVNFILAGCTISIKLSKEKPTAQPHTGGWRCEPVSDEFQATDLVGTWQTTFGLSLIDTLNVSETGFYTQVSVDNTTGYHYESEPKKWWLEKRDDGGVFVHFEGMRYCADVYEGCGDPQEEELGFYDFCSDRWFDMKGEFILAVVGDQSVSGGIRLRHMRPSGDETFSASYTLVEK